MKDATSANATISVSGGNVTSNATALLENSFLRVFCQCSAACSWSGGAVNAGNTNWSASGRAKATYVFNETLFAQNITQLLARYVGSDYNRVVYIITLAVCSLFLMVSLIFLSPFRRLSRNKFLAAALWASQVLPFTVIAHTLGLMQSPPYDNETYAILVALCLLIYGISSSTLYGLHDPQQEKRQIFQEGMLLYLATWSIYLHLPGKELLYLPIPEKELGSKLQPKEKMFPNLLPTEKELHDLGKDERRKLLLAVAVLSILTAVALKFVFRLLRACLAYWRWCRFFGLRRRMKFVADYISVEHDIRDSSISPNPITMTGYKYLVKGEENVEKMRDKEECREHAKSITDKIITVEKIWQCNGGLLRGEGAEKLKDKCLSFALFRLLALRLEGFPLPKEHLSKTRNLVTDGLLRKVDQKQSSEQNNYGRIFRVIEDELSFLHDYRYTQYPLLFSDGMFFTARTTIYAFLELAQFLVGLWIIALFSEKVGTADTEIYGFCHEHNRIWSRFLDFDCDQMMDGVHFWCACSFVVVYLVLRLLELFAIASSDWTKVWLICEYVKQSCLQKNRTFDRLIRFVCVRIVNPFQPWRRRMSQYSLLSSYKYRPIFHFLTAAVFTVPNRGQEIQDSKQLSQDVEKAVIDAFKNKDSQSTNTSSLKRHIDTRQVWVTELILVLHVATSFCALDREYGNKSEEKEPAKVKQDREVAECLSRYSAYLVAFVPALLPDPTHFAEELFDQAILDARQVLGERHSLKDVYNKLNELVKKNEADRGTQAVKVGGIGENVEQGMCRVLVVYDKFKKKEQLKRKNEEAPTDSTKVQKTVVVWGAVLGKQLLSDAGDDKEQLWADLKIFWAEMMLFLASYNKQTAHIEGLANGGEFITHLWALLTHVGRCEQESHDSIDPAANSRQPVSIPGAVSELGCMNG